MGQPGSKRGRAWFWVGVVLLSINALWWILLIVLGGDTGDAVITGVITTIVPVGIGIYCVRRGRKSSAITGDKGGEIISLDHVKAATEAMKDTEGQSVIASHKVGFRNKLEITDRGIRDRRLATPYSRIMECNCLRNYRGVPDRCFVKYVDETGLERLAEFGGKAIIIYSDIIRVSMQYGHRISHRQAPGIAQIQGSLKTLGVEAEFLEPDVEHNDQEESFWRLGLGGLKLTGTNIDTITVIERGTSVTNTSAAYKGLRSYSETKVGAQYHIDYLIRTKTISAAARLVGNPVKKRLRGVIDFHWHWNMEGNKIARSLNEDNHLHKMLVEARAPAMEITENHIRVQDKEIPTVELLRCIDRIAGHVRQAAS